MEKPHKKLDAWKVAMELVENIYRLTATFPSEERYGLVTQMRRASVSVVSNIAEGAARSGKKEFAQFLSMAQGSLSELDTQVELVRRLGYAKPEDLNEIDALMQRVDKLLTGLIKSLRAHA